MLIVENLKSLDLDEGKISIGAGLATGLLLDG